MTRRLQELGCVLVVAIAEVQVAQVDERSKMFRVQLQTFLEIRNCSFEITLKLLALAQMKHAARSNWYLLLPLDFYCFQNAFFSFNILVFLQKNFSLEVQSFVILLIVFKNIIQKFLSPRQIGLLLKKCLCQLDFEVFILWHFPVSLLELLNASRNIFLVPYKRPSEPKLNSSNLLLDFF